MVLHDQGMHSEDWFIGSDGFGLGERRSLVHDRNGFKIMAGGPLDTSGFEGAEDWLCNCGGWIYGEGGSHREEQGIAMGAQLWVGVAGFERGQAGTRETVSGGIASQSGQFARPLSGPLFPPSLPVRISSRVILSPFQLACLSI